MLPPNGRRRRFARTESSTGVAEHDRSAIYLELLPVVNAGAVELPDDPNLLRELHGLERQRGSVGRDCVDLDNMTTA